jgi:predicted nucleic acid-binding Zn ribbon protein
MNESQEQFELARAEEHFRRYRRREPQVLSAGDLLSRLIAQRGFTQERFQQDLQDAWQRAIGPALAGKTQATLIRRGALEVLVESSPAMQQLAFLKNDLLKKIQTALPEAQIRSIRFKVGPLRR